MEICIIDDDKIYQFLLRKIINIVNPEIKIHSYYNGSEAIKAFEKIDSCCHIILLDLNMPKMDGWEFIEAYQKMKTDFRSIPKIYISTSSISENDKIKANSYPMVKGYLTKPITVKIIEEIIQ